MCRYLILYYLSLSLYTSPARSLSSSLSLSFSLCLSISLSLSLSSSLFLSLSLPLPLSLYLYLYPSLSLSRSLSLSLSLPPSPSPSPSLYLYLYLYLSLPLSLFLSLSPSLSLSLSFSLATKHYSRCCYSDLFMLSSQISPLPWVASTISRFVQSIVSWNQVFAELSIRRLPAIFSCVSRLASRHFAWCIQVFAIGLYREIAIAIQKESGDSNGGNV